jgi:hypothetical protein
VNASDGTIHLKHLRRGQNLEFPAIPDSWIINTVSVKMMPPQKHFFSLYFRKKELLNFWPIKELYGFPSLL